MRSKIFAILVSLTIVSAIIYLNNRTLPRQIVAFVGYYYRQHVSEEKFTCEPFWKRINNTQLRFTQSPDFANYSVPMYEYLNSTTVNITSTGTNCPSCTNLLLKEAFRSGHKIPFNGTWLRYIVKQSTDRYHFHPHFCSLSEKDLTRSYIRTCLAKKNIRKLVAIGDSNSLKLMEAIVRVFSKSLDHCDVVAVESFGKQTDPKYYLRNVSFNLSDVSFLKCPTRTCTTRRYVCSYNTTGEDPEKRTENRTLELEQILNSRIIDGSRIIKVKIGQFLPTNISQEFLLRDYLRFERYPDILLYQTPFTHEIYFGLIKSPAATGELREPLQKLRKLVTKYVPSTTSVYWMPNQDISESDPRASYRNPLLRQSIDAFSEAMDSLLGSTSNNMFPFFDIFELSRPIKSLHIPKDPPHMKPEWYDIIAKYILELHCNS